MPIIHMTDQRREIYPEGAYSPLFADYGKEGIVLYETHHGLCIQDWERNGYDDSDFYMTVWNEETQRPEDICFASTRGWSYPCYGSSPDATPEIRAKYEAWCEQQKRAAHARMRRDRANVLRKRRALLLKAAQAHNLPVTARLRLQKLRHEWTQETFDGLLKLLTANLRSPFRKSLREQTINWAQQDKPEWPHPLSAKQRMYL